MAYTVAADVHIDALAVLIVVLDVVELAAPYAVAFAACHAVALAALAAAACADLDAVRDAD